MKGYSLHIGVNEADPDSYPGLNPLKAAVNDAKWWAQFAEALGYDTESLHDSKATTKAVKKQLKEYAELMKAGDILLLTYSGHGDQLPNAKPDHIDKEKMDQTWCLYDRELLDDEIYAMFKAFKEGTRILVVADSCHSGTVTRVAEHNLSQALTNGMNGARGLRGMASRQVPDAVSRAIIDDQYDTVYAPIQEQYVNTSKRKGVKAAVKLLAACQDHQVTYDGEEYGIFTEALSRLIAENPNATAETLVNGVRAHYSFPKPNFFQYGSIIPDFDSGFPFAIKLKDSAVTGYREPVSIDYETCGADDYFTGQVDRNAVVMATITGGLNGSIEGGAEIAILDKKETGNETTLVLEMKNFPLHQGWSAAHALQQGLLKSNIAADVEPILSYNPNKPGGVSRAADDTNADYIPEWPPATAAPVVKMGWHLDDEHSQLATAAARVLAKPDAHVKIAHFDTGYIEGHKGLPKKLATDLARSFVNGEEPNQAIDKNESGNDGHGLGTICLLAGNEVGGEITFNEYSGYMGGAFMADVIPVRVSDSVVIFNSKNFCDAIDYAIEQGCEVITMSMAGKPDKAMAKAVNRAYEAGVVIVSAASNCWYKGAKALLPKCVLFPAAFDRVIAATGAMYDHKPYDQKYVLDSGERSFTQYMQGSWGPASRMNKAIAGYTPNTPWASTKFGFVRNGGGTSSATPQVAATAALYIAYHRDEMEAKGYYEEGKQWMKVEAVRHALYTSAAKEDVFDEYKTYYGNGIIRANDALNIPVAEPAMLEKAKDARSSFAGIVELAGSLFLNRKLFRDANTQRPSEEALGMELLHLLQTDPAFYADFSSLDLSSEAEVKALIEKPEFAQRVMESVYASEYLKEAVRE
jgi:hypothetical protein